MKQSDLVAKVAEQINVPQTEAGKIVTAVLSAIEGALKSGSKVAIAGFGNFSVTDREAREGRNPRTGETVQIAASKAVKFSPAKGLKDALVG